ncbi:hypothetical protein SAMN04488066_10411 [Halorubrum aquaticum]|uniref:Exonuclease RecJ n=1 Tax=Halorubrum aquaticum TaxID=387340 RepID=A0A1I3A0Y8_9EURY|nr:exonuclease RecJ [Halorubrum aquaticum]SFH43560.1 hypothetical protein SAMN04488066_10411 [Halorubrum aquaticum]
MTETTVESAPAPDALASVLADAPFVRLVATDDGDALAAAGTLARALRERAVPFQVRVARDPVPDADGDDVAVVLGADRGPHAVPGSGRPASTTAFAVARELGVEPDPAVPLAGVVAAGSVPGTDGSGDALEAAEHAGTVSRRPGVAVPTADLADGIAASTLVRTPYSGDVEATRAVLAELGLPADLEEADHRRLASRVAVDAVADEDASTRSASAVERALRPYALGAAATPFETVGGYADVLEALAREEPGTGVALALATDPSDGLRTAAVDAWRSHGTAAHRAIDAATTGRYDGCLVARVDAPESTLPTVARLVRDFRSPESVAIVLDESSGTLAAAATGDHGIGDACRSAAREAGGDGWGDGTRGGIAVDGDPTDALAALRGAL